jgi:20S proteasome alpha/beta subunit
VISVLGNNILAAPIEACNPFPKLKKRKIPVTIIVGIITKDEIVLASDSQTTFGTSKLTDVEKISMVEFSNTTALVAESGAAEQSGMAVELMQKKARGVKLTDYAMMAELAQQSLREVRSYLIKLNEGCNFTEDKWERYFRDENPVELMTANYFEGTPYIYTVSLHTCMANRAKLHYQAIGCGANIGGYMLSELSYPKMDSELATAIAVYVVESVKKHDAYCGGATKVAILRQPKIDNPLIVPASAALHGYTGLTFPTYPLPPCKVFSKDEVEKLVEIVSKMDNKTKKQRHNIIQHALRKETEDYFKDLGYVKSRRNALSHAISKASPIKKTKSKE